jgi:hypothetical protein
MSVERRTPARTVSNVSPRFVGRESSRFGGSGLPVNSSWTDIVACLRQTASSWTYCQFRVKLVDWYEVAYGWNS